VATDSSIGTLASPNRAIPARSPSASANGRTEDQGHVLDRVVVVDVEIAPRRDLEVEEAVVGE